MLPKEVQNLTHNCSGNPNSLSKRDDLDQFICDQGIGFFKLYAKDEGCYLVQRPYSLHVDWIEEASDENDYNFWTKSWDHVFENGATGTIACGYYTNEIICRPNNIALGVMS